jgi:group I intron endonuclease
MGRKPANSLFNEEQESAIVQAYVEGKTVLVLSKKYNCSKNVIHRILDGAGVVRKPYAKEANPSPLQCQLEAAPFPECRFSGIYKFTNRVNGKVYIGQSRNIYLRYKEHRKDQNSGMSIAIKKYGIESFNFEVIERVDDLTNLNEREQYWLDYYQAFRRSRGYNRAKLVTNFKLGRKHSAEANLALGIRMKAYWANNPNPNLGRKYSEETRKKISEAKLRNPLTKEQYDAISIIRVKKMTKRVAQIDLKTSQLIQVWESVTAIQQQLGIPAASIRYACRGFQNNKNGRYPKTSHAGYRWEYTDLEPAIYDKAHKTNLKSIGKRVAQIDIESGKTLRVWTGAKQVNQELRLPIEAIRCVCRGYIMSASGRLPTSSYGGYRWQYVE